MILGTSGDGLGDVVCGDSIVSDFSEAGLVRSTSVKLGQTLFVLFAEFYSNVRFKLGHVPLKRSVFWVGFSQFGPETDK